MGFLRSLRNWLPGAGNSLRSLLGLILVRARSLVHWPYTLKVPPQRQSYHELVRAGTGAVAVLVCSLRELPAPVIGVGAPHPGAPLTPEITGSPDAGLLPFTRKRVR